MTKEEQLPAITSCIMLEADMVNVMVHDIDSVMIPSLKEEIKLRGYVMTQYNLKPGLRKFGAKETTAAIKELTQLLDMDTWMAMDPSKISREDWMRALSFLLFLKEKQTGKVKGQACTNGAPQWAYISKEDAASPTMSTESPFITACIVASKRKKVQCYNVPGAFVNMDVDEDMLMVLKGEMVEMMKGADCAPSIQELFFLEEP
jgi:hypothetical protein